MTQVNTKPFRVSAGCNICGLYRMPAGVRQIDTAMPLCCWRASYVQVGVVDDIVTLNPL